VNGGTKKDEMLKQACPELDSGFSMTRKLGTSNPEIFNIYSKDRLEYYRMAKDDQSQMVYFVQRTLL
jgi:hypothetical protein